MTQTPDDPGAPAELRPALTQPSASRESTRSSGGRTSGPGLTVEALESRIAPAVATDKKTPVPPPYAPGTLYGLVRRDNLRR